MFKRSLTHELMNRENTTGPSGLQTRLRKPNLKQKNIKQTKLKVTWANTPNVLFPFPEKQQLQVLVKTSRFHFKAIRAKDASAPHSLVSLHGFLWQMDTASSEHSSYHANPLIKIPATPPPPPHLPPHQTHKLNPKLCI